MYTHIVVVVFGILMEFVLYATVIAGTTTIKHQHKENLSLCGRVMMMTPRYVFFILCP